MTDSSGCVLTDTSTVTMNVLPVLTWPQPMQVCKSAMIVNLNSFTTNQPGGTGLWSYPQAPGALVLPGGPGVTGVYTDSLKSLPYDTANYATNVSFTNQIYYKYTSPLAFGGCTSYDSAIVKIYGNPYVIAGFDVKWCLNGGIFKLQNDGTRNAPYNSPLWVGSPSDATGVLGVWTGNGVNTVL